MFDRMLVAQAIVHGMIIVTPDPIVARYIPRGQCGEKAA
jgi:PIN domain nuclease of toxin-antitoxin system